MTYMLLLNCALKLVEEIILHYDARSKKHKKHQIIYNVSVSFLFCPLLLVIVGVRVNVSPNQTQ